MVFYCPRSPSGPFLQRFYSFILARAEKKTSPLKHKAELPHLEPVASAGSVPSMDQCPE